MNKFTQGPWVLNHEERRIEILGNKKGGSFDLVTFVANARTSPAKQAQAFADAQLIAAAPEMLEALKQCREVLSLAGPGSRGVIAYDSAVRAIAKAEGRK